MLLFRGWGENTKEKAKKSFYLMLFFRGWGGGYCFTHSYRRLNPYRQVKTLKFKSNPTGMDQICIKNASLLNLFQDLAALAFDAAHVITQAVGREPCSQINWSSMTPEDMDAMLTCFRKVHYHIFNFGYPLLFKFECVTCLNWDKKASIRCTTTGQRGRRIWDQ